MNVEARSRRVGLFVQARMGSSRLPGKVVREIRGRRVLDWVLERAGRSKRCGIKVVLTSTNPEDAALAELGRARGWQAWQGPERDVLARFSGAADTFRCEDVVRITSDCPLVDPGLVDFAVSEYLASGCDYLCLSPVLDGVDVEVFSAEALAYTHRHAELPSEREHVTQFMRRSPHLASRFVPYGPDLSRTHLSVDYPEDLQVIEAVITRLADKGLGDAFSYEDVIGLLREDPGITETNRHRDGFAGLEQSRREDIAFVRGLKASPLKLDRNLALLAATRQIVPNCSQTFSKSYTQFSHGVSPVFAERADGCHVWDVDGNRYIDTTMALGPAILGYAHPKIDEVIRDQLSRGISYTLPHRLELELAQRLIECIPCAEMVRFAKNGSDVTSAAVRVARGYTGRDHIVCCGYHGWQDWYIGSTFRDLGVPGAVKALTHVFAYNDLDGLERIFAEHKGEIAAVVMEPVGIHMPGPGFLEAVKSLAHREGALLVFDEVITGFRMAMGGAQEYFGVTPDLACFGKALGNGMPISAVCGRRDVMRLFEEVFFSFTFGGEALSLAAALATLDELDASGGISIIWRQGERLKGAIEEGIRHYELEGVVAIEGYAPRQVWSFLCGDDALLHKTLIQQECIRRGLLFTGSQMLSLAHTDAVIDEVAGICRQAMSVLHHALTLGIVGDLLDGSVVEAVFRRP